MYCTDFICTYQHSKNEDEQDYIYRSQFLQAFNLEYWDNDVINKEILELFNKIKDIDGFKNIFNKLKKSKKNGYYLLIIGHDDLTLFKLLFNYEYFYITHKVLCSYLNDNVLLISLLEELIE